MASARAKAIKGVEAIFDRYHLIAKSREYNGFDRHLMESLKIVDASAAGTVDFELLMDERYTNLNGVMHGGAAGVIFDMCTTSALGPLAKPGYWDFMGGVTRSLNISYLRAIPIGTTIVIRGEVTQAGRTMAMIRGTMKSLDDHLKYRIPWDGLWDAEKPKL